MGFRRWFPSQKAINAENVIMSWRNQIKTGKGVCVCVCVGGGGGGGGGGGSMALYVVFLTTKFVLF